MTVILDEARNFVKIEVESHGSLETQWQLRDVTDAQVLPPPPFNVVVYNDTDFPDASDDPNKEIYRVLNVNTTTGVLSGLRAQEGTTASTKNVPQKRYLMRLTPTAKLVSDLKSHIEDESRHRRVDFHESEGTVKWAWFSIE